MVFTLEFTVLMITTSRVFYAKIASFDLSINKISIKIEIIPGMYF